jgi:curved DNA-binding protein CbpA
MDRDALRAWLTQLDQMSFYRILDLAPDASTDAIVSAFHVFSRTFHPDQHVARDADERVAVGRIFRRGAEAYRILSSPDLRRRYDEALARGEPHETASLVPAAYERSSVAAKPQRLEDHVRSQSARPFVRRAEELAEQGDLPRARLQIKLAISMDPGNDALIAFERSILARTKPPTE